MTSLAHAALDQLSALLGKRCLTDPDSAQRYGVDWTKVWAPAPSAVVLPETTEEVQQIVEIANEHGLHLVPSGGRTGLSAGAVAAIAGSASTAVVAPETTLGSTISTFNDKDTSTWAYWRKEMPAIPASILRTIIEEKGLGQPEIFFHTFKNDAALDKFLLTLFGDDWDASPHCGRFRQIISWMQGVFVSTVAFASAEQEDLPLDLPAGGLLPYLQKRRGLVQVPLAALR